MYGGPVVLVGDSTTYSSGDLFSAGFVDNRIGPFICVGSATGAGGANVWSYGELRQALAGSPAALPALPDGIGLVVFVPACDPRACQRRLPIEDVGVAGTPYAMTRDDLLYDNRDLIGTCVAMLRTAVFPAQCRSRPAAPRDQRDHARHRPARCAGRWASWHFAKDRQQQRR